MKRLALCHTLIILSIFFYSCNKSNHHKRFDENTLSDVSKKIKSSKVFNDSLEFISLIIDSNDLYGKNGIVTNFQEHGINWEKPVKLIWYQNGNEIQNINAGLRLKGNSGRSSESLESNRAVKIHFRKEYSKKKFNYHQDQNHDSAYLIKKLTLRKSWQCAEELAYVIYNKIGAKTNFSKPIGLFVNGKYYGLYSMLDSQHKKNFKLTSGNDNFIYYRYRYEKNSLSDIYHFKKLDKLVYNSRNSNNKFIKTYKSLPIPGFETIQKMSYEKIDEIVNIELLSRQIAATIIVGNSDWNQGVLIREHESGDKRYYWQMIDLDNSFLDMKANQGAVDPFYPWNQKSIELITSGYGGIRAEIFTRLIKEDSLYSKYFIDLMFNILNHELDSSFLKNTIDDYIKICKAYDRPNLEEFKSQTNQFIQNRPHFVMRKLTKYFKKDSLYSFQVELPDSIKYKIDGYSKNGNFNGKYYSGKKIQIQIQKDCLDLFDLKKTLTSKKNIFEVRINRNIKLTVKD
jgi:hypothetical protein